MSKRQEIRQRRQRERTRNRILVIVLVAAGALLIAFAFIKPLLFQTQATASATQSLVIVITPKAIVAKVNGVHLGDPNALVKVDVYEDFRCSACSNYTTNYEPQIIQTYVDTGKVYYTFHSFIVIDGNDGTDASFRSANAALCASEQGHFWDYHDTLYANQVTESASLFTDERLVTMAKNLNLDMTAFTQCYQAKKYASDINNDISQAHTRAGIRVPRWQCRCRKILTVAQIYANIQSRLEFIADFSQKLVALLFGGIVFNPERCLAIHDTENTTPLVCPRNHYFDRIGGSAKDVHDFIDVLETGQYVDRKSVPHKDQKRMSRRNFVNVIRCRFRQ